MPTGPEVKVRLTVDGSPEAVAAFERLRASGKTAAKDIGQSFGDLRGVMGQVQAAVAAIGFVKAAQEMVRWADSAINAGFQTEGLADRIGASVKFVQQMGLAQKLAGSETENLSKSISRFATFLDKANTGAKDATRTLGNLGLTVKDLAGKSTEDAFRLVLQRIAEMPAGLERVATVKTIFGRGGDAVAEMAGKVKEATAFLHQFGLTLTNEDAAGLSQLHDKMVMVHEAISVMGQKFWAGWAWPVLDAIRVVSGESNDMGKAVGDVGNWIGNVWRKAIIFVADAADETITDMKVIGIQAAKLIEGLQKLSQGRVASGLADLYLGMNEAYNEAAEAKLTGGLASRHAARVAAMGQWITAPFQADKKFGLVPEGEGDAKQKKGLDLEKRFAQDRAGLLKAESDQAVALLKAEYDQKEITVKAYYDGLEKVAQDELKNEQDEIVTSGGTWDAYETARTKFQTKMLDLSRQRADAIKKLSDEQSKEAEKAAEEAQRRAQQEYAASAAGRIAAQLESIRQSALDIAASSLAEVFNSAASGGQSLVQTLQRIGQSLAQVLSQWLALQALGLFIHAPEAASAFTTPDITGIPLHAKGGLIRGPGTGTSDSILARLSAGEYVVPAATVARPGVLGSLQRLVHGRIGPALEGATYRFASGGYVPAPVRTSLMGSFDVNLGPGLVASHIKTNEVLRSLLHVTQSNSRQFRQALGIA